MRLNEFSGSTVDDTLQYSKELSPLAWENDALKENVRQHLIAIADSFVESLDIPEFKVLDVVLTGSMCNYNYTKYSDFDLHVITDYSIIDAGYDMAALLYRAKKDLWNHLHDIKIHGYDVELYIEDVKEPPMAQGVYSLVKDKWIKHPKYAQPNVDNDSVKRKAEAMQNQIQQTIAHADSVDDFSRMLHSIKRMRQSGLDKDGEFSTENLAFKVIRNSGLIEELRTAMNNFQDRQLSL